MTSEADKNKEKDIVYFTNTLLNIAKEQILKSSTSTKYNRIRFNEEYKKPSNYADQH